MFSLEEKYFDKFRNGLERVLETDSFIRCKCKVCNEGNSHRYKSRGYFLKNKDYRYYCHNCQAGMKFSSYLWTFHKDLYSQYKAEINETKLSSLKDENLIIQNDKKEKLLVKTNIDKNLLIDITKIKKFNKIKPNSLHYAYLVKRKVSQELIKTFYSYDNYIVHPLYYKNNEIYGFTLKSINPTLTKVKNKITIFDDKYFSYHNIFNINKNKKVYIGESIYDISNVDPNWIAVNTAKVNLEYIELFGLNKENVIITFDNDLTGLTSMLKYVKLGYSISTWFEQYNNKDLNELSMLGININKLVKSTISKGDLAEFKLKLELSKWK